MSRRKQARPIRVLESEEGLNNLSALNLANSVGNSEAGSGSENSSCESETDEAYAAKTSENNLSENGIVANPVFERLKTNVHYDHIVGKVRDVGACKKMICANESFGDARSLKAEFEDDTAAMLEDGHEAGDEGRDDDEDGDDDDDEDDDNDEDDDDHDNDGDDEMCSNRDANEDGSPMVEVREKRRTSVKQKQKQKQSEENDDNNNNNSTDNYDEPEENGCESELRGGQTPFRYSLPTSHVTLEALQNTKVAVAQFAATALANSADNPVALQELAVLQSHLYTLQHQHLMHINMIHHLQQQLKITRSSGRQSSSPTFTPSQSQSQSQCESETNLSPSSLPIPLVVTRPSSPSPSILTPPKSSRTPTPVKQDSLHAVCVSPPTSQPLLSTGGSGLAGGVHQSLKTSVPSSAVSSPAVALTLPPCSISSSFASSIITNLDPPPSPSEPNTLEMLQKRAQEVLDNASQGLLANNLADELAFRKNGANGKGSALSPYDSKTGSRNEPFFKHRCRYCGKVFGSDSALQIHIRSHTGERPFKCNVCGSRFTTKGNLKVHFQRHTSKFPHIKMNPNPVPEHLDKYHPPLLAQMNSHQSLPAGMAGTHGTHHASIPLASPGQQFPANVASFSNSLSHLYRPPSAQTSHHDLTSLPSQHRLAHDSLLKPLVAFPSFFGQPTSEQDQPENLCKPASSNHSYSPPSLSEHSEYNKRDMTEDEETQALSETSETTNEYQRGLNDTCSRNSIHDDMECCDDERETSTKKSTTGRTKNAEVDSDENIADRRSNSPFDRCSVASKYSNDDQRSPPIVGERDSLTDANAVSSHREDSYQEQPENLTNKIRGNTTCNICYKTFACNSALEIHYRSHTKERPFKCTVCDRGFSTKGNMKQHMLTHKIRDMPSHLFEKSSPGSVSVPSSLVDETSNTSTESKEPIQPASTIGLRCVPIESLTTSLQKVSALPVLATALPEAITVPSQKRSPDNDSTLPVPKRQPSLPKHLCRVCNKNFSSSSALQIHMRTHTGDKPFRCTVCMKAFTTKGNLKVHMGTHMWTNGASRRGRRMSLELPSLPLTSKEPQTDLFHRRPDLFYPYLPTPFLNGVHQKLNEISGMQNVSANLTNGFFPFGAYTGSLNELKRPTSPVSPPMSGVNRHLNSADSHSASSPWNLHFERKTIDENVESCTPSPPHQSQHQPHGEGLAA